LKTNNFFIIFTKLFIHHRNQSLCH
jgi:hypothetical protein